MTTLTHNGILYRILAALSIDPDDAAASDALRRHLLRAGEQPQGPAPACATPAACERGAR